MNAAETLSAQVNALASEHWNTLKKPAKTSLVWQYCLTDPLPVSWPMTSPNLVVYAYAHGLDISRPTQGEVRANIWGKIIIEESKLKGFVALASELIPEGPKGVRPLSAAELKILSTNPIKLFYEKMSDDTAQAIKLRYQLQLTLGNIPESLVTNHSDFFTWIK